MRLYIRMSGCRLWCAPIRAVLGHSIETYCGGRSSQYDPVEVITEPSIWERCTACELAADEAFRARVLLVRQHILTLGNSLDEHSRHMAMQAAFSALDTIGEC